MLFCLRNIFEDKMRTGREQQQHQQQYIQAYLTSTPIKYAEFFIFVAWKKKFRTPHFVFYLFGRYENIVAKKKTLIEKWKQISIN